MRPVSCVLHGIHELSWPAKAGNLAGPTPTVKPALPRCIDGSPGYHVYVTPSERSSYVMGVAKSLGLDRCGIAAAGPIGRATYLRTWLDSGRAGTMEYLNRHFIRRADPRVLLPDARSIIVVAQLYHQPRPTELARDERRRGRVAMYAWGDDYHDVVKAKLHKMVDQMRIDLSEPFESKVCVDTVPLLEREVAAAAGIGWIGKNTLVLDHRLGSYFFLGAVLTTLEFAPDEPAVDHCGTCTACLDACPTEAFPAPYEMDASKCISYLTIEHRGEILKPDQERMGDWIFGCDVCQEVCPYNRDAPFTKESRFAIRSPGADPALDDILSWTTDDYRQELRGSAMKRAKPDMLKRNAQIAVTNLTRSARACP